MMHVECLNMGVSMRHTIAWFFILFASHSFAQPQDYNALGIDPRVDYNELYRVSVAAGIPWDDRNLDLIKEELDSLPPGDFEDSINIPIFHRIAFRQAHPDLRESGKGQYPMSAAEVFDLFFGGIYRDGMFIDHETSRTVIIDGEVEITPGRKSAESAIAINPVDPNRVIAGVNGPSGQEMYYSADGGVTWTRSLSDLGGSCCDPTVGWSADGQTAFMAQLGTCFFLCNIEFFTSSNYGQTWGNKVTIQGGLNNDKEFIHVDHCPASPYYGRIYAHWHRSNTIYFAHSDDNGVTFSTPISFAGTQGIGGDIATDRNGKIYQIWSNFGNQTVLVNTSVNGGANFGPITQVATTNAEFNFDIPCFDRRSAPIIISVAADISDGPYANRVYACWADTDAPAVSNPTNNHALIRFVFSADGGVSWISTNPHSLADILTVDRFNPWMDLDEQGIVHMVFYSTQNDPARLRPDLYHTTSEDGGQTWDTPVRVTSVSSNYINDSFQWGDYNGLSVVNGEIRPIWTDNRSAVRVFTADMSRFAGGDFTITAEPEQQTICVGDSLQSVTIHLSPIDGFSELVSVSFSDLPQGFSGDITNSPTTLPADVIVEVDTDFSAQEGANAIVVEATGGPITHDVTVRVFVRTKTVIETLDLWRSPSRYDVHYDFDGDGRIDLIDLLRLQTCMP